MNTRGHTNLLLATIAASVMASAVALADPAPAVQKIIEAVDLAAQTGLALRYHGDVAASLPYYETCVTKLDELSARIGRDAMFQLTIDDINLSSFRGQCENYRREAARAPARTDRPQFELALAKTPGGEPASAFSCGEPIYGTARYGNVRDISSVGLFWRIDGTTPPALATLPLSGVVAHPKQSGHISPSLRRSDRAPASASPGASGEISFTVVPAPASDETLDELTSIRFLTLGSLTPGDHVVKVGLGDPLASWTETTITLSCDRASIAHARSIYDAQRHKRLAGIHWTPTEPALHKWDSILVGLIAAPSDVKVLAVSTSSDHIYDGSRGNPKHRMVEFVAGLRLNDASCAVAPGWMQEFWNIEDQTWVNRAVTMFPEKKFEIDCSELGSKGKRR